MIFLPSHRLLSNGNKWIWLGLFLISFTISCDLFKKLPDTDPISDTDEDLNDIQGPKQIDPETGEFEIVTNLSEDMDTIKWTMNSPDKFPPITSDTPYQPSGNGDGVVAGSGGPYRISMLLPFFTDRFYSASGEIYENSDWALQFYVGTKVAISQLEQEGCNLQFYIYD